jgi:hypothetical protein
MTSPTQTEHVSEQQLDCSVSAIHVPISGQPLREWLEFRTVATRLANGLEPQLQSRCSSRRPYAGGVLERLYQRSRGLRHSCQIECAAAGCSGEMALTNDPESAATGDRDACAARPGSESRSCVCSSVSAIRRTRWSGPSASTRAPPPVEAKGEAVKEEVLAKVGEIVLPGQAVKTA